MITWDESKRQENLRKHGLDFVGCETVFDHPVVTWDDDREAYHEQRLRDCTKTNYLIYMTVDSGFQPVFGPSSRLWPSPGKIFLKNQ